MTHTCTHTYTWPHLSSTLPGALKLHIDDAISKGSIECAEAEEVAIDRPLTSLTCHLSDSHNEQQVPLLPGLALIVIQYSTVSRSNQPA